MTNDAHKSDDEHEDDNEHKKTKKPVRDTDCEQPVASPHGDDRGKHDSKNERSGDEDSGKSDDKKKDDEHDDGKRPKPPAPVTPPPPAITTTGTVTRTPQTGNNAPGRKVWREVTTSAK